eukprot:CAMPEP_0177661684 /NCGR_PEP_ID=MMETSP0447-20121125/18839_1 /TAXON_ID=0 /ORGANISM="Stygamoeba regulata, Strain BSH-02190019" /LENGTH=155 /DNA_ID=CAMNT_0019167101 /DNA_START=115 /DNA_END=582 /DNA_ORIENTATION=-
MDRFEESLKAIISGDGSTSSTKSNSSKSAASSSSRNQDYKMVMCVRTDLKMGKGKAAAQCCHATLGAYQRAMRKPKFASMVEGWEQRGQAKVALKINSQEEMQELEAAATAEGLNSYIVVDAGRTQIPSGSWTVLAIGPGPVDQINKVTGMLKLF